MAYLIEGSIQNGHQCFVAAGQGGAVEDWCMENDVPSFALGSGLLSLPANVSLITKICRQYQIDIIHTHDAKAHTLAVVSSVTGNKVPIIVSRKVDFPVKKTWISYRKYNHPNIKKVICVSEKISEITGKAIRDKNRVEVVYDGVETEFNLPEILPDLREMFEFPANNRIVGNVAALAPHKDFFTWVDAVELILRARRDVSFLAVGEGRQGKQIEDYIQSKNLGGHILLTGFRKDAKDLMTGMDVFMNSSETEGLCSSILDAYVRNVPVVATNAGGIPEIVSHEGTGLLAQVKDAQNLANNVLKVLSDGELRQRLVNNASVFVKQFDKKVMVEKTLEVYRKVLSQGKF